MNDRYIWWGGAILGVLTLIGLWHITTRPSPEPLMVNTMAESTPRTTSRSSFPAFPSEPEPELTEPLPPEDNAAVTYREAFGLLNSFTKEEKEILSNWQTNVDARVTEELCAKLEPVLDLIHKAAAQTNCDWGTGEISVNTQFPHFTPARAMARAALWRATHCGKSDVFADDVVAVIQLGSHLSADGPMIAQLVDWAFQEMASACVATNLASLDATSAHRIIEHLTSRDLALSLGKSLAWEIKIAESMAAEIEKLSPEEFTEQRNQAAKLIGDEGFKGDKTQVLQAISQTTALQSELAQVLASGAAQDLADWQTKARQLGSTNHFAAMLLGGFDLVFAKMSRMEVQRALLLAAASLVVEGAGALEAHLDPASGDPFEYRETENGFELRSTMLHNDKPISLFIPMPPTNP